MQIDEVHIAMVGTCPFFIIEFHSISTAGFNRNSK